MNIQRLSSLTRFLPNPLPVVKISQPIQTDQATEQDELATIPEWQAYEAPLRPSNHLGVRLGQHWTVVGATGSGKTRFGVALLEYIRRQYPTVKRYILNSSADSMAGVYSPIEVEGNAVPDLLVRPDHTLIWTPDIDDLEAYNTWLLKLLAAREPAIVFLDEIASLLSKNGDALEGHIKLLKQGRKHGITVMNLTQEITKVPTAMFRQMSHYVQFRIGEDTPELSAARRFLHVTKEQQRNPLNQYGFYHRKTSINSPTREYRDLQEFFKSSLQGGKQGVSWAE
jgi:DNA helicase HerA-like ATPase